MARLLSEVVMGLMDERDVSPQRLAVECDVSYQTIRNILDGKSVSARVAISIAKHFDLQETSELREFFLGFLRLQFDGVPDAKPLLTAAGLDGTEQTN